MVPVYGQIRHLVVGHSCALGQQTVGAVLVEAHHREPAVGRYLRRVRTGDETVGVAGVADHEHPHARSRVLRDGPALRLEGSPVDAEQILPLHAGLAGDRTDEKGERGPAEGGCKVACRFDAGQQGERTVLELHHDTLEHLHRRLDLEQPQHDGLTLAVHLARRDAEEEGVTDLSCGTGDGDLDGSGHPGAGGARRASSVDHGRAD